MNVQENINMIELPIINDRASGFIKSRGKWCMFYYEDGKTKRISTGTADLDTALIFRDNMHLQLVSEGATYRTKAKPALQAAINDPKGDACIYTCINYRVIVDGVPVGASTDKDKAIAIRNKYIKDNYELT